MSDMNDKIFDFVGDLLRENVENKTCIKVKTRDDKHIVWFLKDTQHGGLSIWVTDVQEDIDLVNAGEDPDTKNPWDYYSTVALAADYKLDMWRRELDEGATASTREKCRQVNQQMYSYMREQASTAREYLEAYLDWYVRNQNIKLVDIIKDEVTWYRMTADNVFHVGTLLKWSTITKGAQSWRWLDCYYNDGTFSFFLYSPGLPHETKHMIISELDTYGVHVNSDVYMMANSYVNRSNTSKKEYDDAFFLEDIVAENRKPRGDKVKNEVDGVLSSYSNFRSAEAAYNNNTDPDQEESLKDAMEQAKQDWQDGVEQLLDVDCPDVAIRDTDWNHHKEDVPAEDWSRDYDSYLIGMFRFDSDYDIQGDEKFTVNGETLWFRWHINRQFLQVWNVWEGTPSWPVVRTLRVPKLVAWYDQRGHWTYEDEFNDDDDNDVGVIYNPLLDQARQTIETPDYKQGRFDKYTWYLRHGTGGNSVNTHNNQSQLMPIIWYVQRDEDGHRDDWSAVGQTNKVNYINMYNMCTGRIIQMTDASNYQKYACYYLWMRRPRWTDFLHEINNDVEDIDSIFGIGGYPGVGVQVTDKDDLTALKNRLVRILPVI